MRRLIAGTALLVVAVLATGCAGEVRFVDTTEGLSELEIRYTAYVLDLNSALRSEGRDLPYIGDEPGYLGRRAEGYRFCEFKGEHGTPDEAFAPYLADFLSRLDDRYAIWADIYATAANQFLCPLTIR